MSRLTLIPHENKNTGTELMDNENSDEKLKYMEMIFQTIDRTGLSIQEAVQHINNTIHRRAK